MWYGHLITQEQEDAAYEIERTKQEVVCWYMCVCVCVCVCVHRGDDCNGVCPTSSPEGASASDQEGEETGRP